VEREESIKKPDLNKSGFFMDCNLLI